MRSGSSSRPWLPNRRRGFALFLALALVVVQMLGLAHRIVHADRSQLAGTSAAAAPAGGSDSPAPKAFAHRSGSGWLLAVFSGHDPTHDCDAFDQMSHADFVAGVTIEAVAPPAPPAEACFMHAAWHLAAQARGFLARGPPLAA